MSTTLPLAVASVYGALATTTDSHVSPPVSALTALGVKKVYDHEPASGTIETPVSVTVFGAGWTPTEWLVEVRVYVSIEKDPPDAEALLNTVCMAVDGLLSDGPSLVTMSYMEDIKAWVGLHSLQVGREDF